MSSSFFSSSRSVLSEVSVFGSLRQNSSSSRQADSGQRSRAWRATRARRSAFCTRNSWPIPSPEPGKPDKQHQVPAASHVFNPGKKDRERRKACRGINISAVNSEIKEYDVIYDMSHCQIITDWLSKTMTHSHPTNFRRFFVLMHLPSKAEQASRRSLSAPSWLQPCPYSSSRLRARPRSLEERAFWKASAATACATSSCGPDSSRPMRGFPQTIAPSPAEASSPSPNRVPSTGSAMVCR